MSSRIALPFVGLFALLALALSGVSVYLVGLGVEDRIHDQLRDTVKLAEKLPLSNPTARHLSLYIHAEVVLVAGTTVLASSLEGQAPPGFVPFPAESAVTIRETEDRIVAASRLQDGRTLYLLYPRELESAERSRATRPVVVLSVVGVLLAALLGALKERSVVRERTQALARLVSGLAHEVKNPLGAIRLTVETLREGTKDPADREALDVVTSEVERLSLLVDQLRLLGGPQRFAPAPCEPGKVLDEVLALLRRTLEHRGLAVERTGEAPAVLVDPRAFKQALLNLLLNAIEASPRGSRIGIVLGAGERARIEVRDEGPGIAGPARSRLFEPFFTTKDGGTGLGLALARRVAREHGGTLELLDAPPPGARFLLELPRA
jgi:signal transduction histidine kinase